MVSFHSPKPFCGVGTTGFTNEATSLGWVISDLLQITEPVNGSVRYVTAELMFAVSTHIFTQTHMRTDVYRCKHSDTYTVKERAQQKNSGAYGQY